MTDQVLDGAITPEPPDDLPANEVHGTAGSSIARLDTGFLYEGSEGGDLQETDPFRRIIDQILNAETPDSVLTPVEAVQANAVIARPLILYGFSLNKSEYDVGSPMYASMECQYADTQEPVVVNTGHRKMMAQLIRLQQLDAFPVAVQVRARGTGQGGTPLLELVKPDVSSEPPPF